jgi:hypothetical protein
MREQVLKEWTNLKVKFKQTSDILAKYSDKSSLVERIEVVDLYLTRISWALAGITKASETELRQKMGSLSNLGFNKLPASELMLLIREYCREKYLKK